MIGFGLVRFLRGAIILGRYIGLSCMLVLIHYHFQRRINVLILQNKEFAIKRFQNDHLSFSRQMNALIVFIWRIDFFLILNDRAVINLSSRENSRDTN